MSEEYGKRSAAQRALFAEYPKPTIVPGRSQLWGETMMIAETISHNAPLAIKAAKITIAEVLKDESARDRNAIKAIGTACMDSADFREAGRPSWRSASRSSGGRDAEASKQRQAKLNRHSPRLNSSQPRAAIATN